MTASLRLHVFVERRIDGGYEHVPQWHYDEVHHDLYSALGQLYCVPHFELPLFQEERRHLPVDVSQEVKERLSSRCVNHSHMTVREALSYRWDALKTVRRYRTTPLQQTDAFVSYTVEQRDGLFQYEGKIEARTHFRSFYNWLHRVHESVGDDGRIVFAYCPPTNQKA